MEADASPDIERHDGLEMWRCRQLGGPVTFKYCRVMNDGLPCPRVIGCWASSFDVTGYLEANFSLEDLEKVFGDRPKDRLARIMDTLSKVKQRKEGEGEP